MKKKEYHSFRDDVHSIKDLIEEKRNELKELKSRLKNLPKSEFAEGEEEAQKEKFRRLLKHLEREIKSLQREL